MPPSATINAISATGRALKLLQRYGIESPGEVSLEDLAMAENLLVVVDRLDGASGRLVRDGDNGVIRVSDALHGQGPRRFVIAHELGHWFLHQNVSQAFVCTDMDLHDYRSNPFETEANLFAAELLMPRYMIPGHVKIDEPQLGLIRSLAENFNVSISAAAMRYVELTKHTCLVVFSDSTGVRWWRAHDKSWIYLTAKQDISPISATAQCLKGESTETMQVVSGYAWFDHYDHGRRVGEVRESAMMLGRTGLVLSLLWLPDAG
jgi:Zn-dependent peptidase ImmA (M78 family)